MNNNVIVLGASNKVNRYSNKAVKLLVEKGYTTIPIHPNLKVIDNIQVLNNMDNITVDIDTITLYLSPTLLENYLEAILNLKVRRVIFNPGTESYKAKKIFENAGIETVEACTLVMLRTNQF